MKDFGKTTYLMAREILLTSRETDIRYNSYRELVPF